MAGEVLTDKWGIERFSKQFFGRTVVGGGVKGTNSQGESAMDYACGWQCVRVGIVLVVKGGGSTD